MWSFWVIRRKHVCKICQIFACKHKTNAKVPTHYRNVCLYSKKVSFYVFIETFMLNTKTIEINNFISFTKKIKQSNVYVRLRIHQGLLRMPHSLFFFRQIISRINTIKSWFILIILFYFKICQKMGDIKNLILFQN